MTSGKAFYWGALVVAVIANVTANTALKIAMASISPDSDKGVALQVLGTASFWVGLFFCGILLVSYLAAIRSLPVSVAYVLVTSLAMVGLVIVERILLGVPLETARILGMGLAICGVWLMTRGA